MDHAAGMQVIQGGSDLGRNVQGIGGGEGLRPEPFLERAAGHKGRDQILDAPRPSRLVERKDVGMPELDQPVHLAGKVLNVLVFQICEGDFIKLDGDDQLVEVIQCGPDLPLPAQADLFQQLVLLEGGARVDVG